MNNDLDYANQINDIDNIVLDFAESSLFKQIKEGNTAATIFLLKTKGRFRGYLEKSEVKHEITEFKLSDLVKFKDDRTT
jgi:hypothetical protein